MRLQVTRAALLNDCTLFCAFSVQVWLNFCLPDSMRVAELLE